MRLPLSLIRSFLSLDLSPEKIAETLTLLGIEVDAIHPLMDSEEQGDILFELSLTPNLGHCLSALGIARELAAALQKPLTLPTFSLPNPKGSPLSERFEARVFAPELCPRYCCRLIEQVSVAPSPPWLQKQLIACGLKPVNQIVDVTNYICLKWGQPLHAFDADLVEGEQLEVRLASHAFRFSGLDGVEREVKEGTPLIADAKKPLALAGLLGGANSAVSSQTRRVLLEAAFFDPMAIRKASKQLNLRTESAIRFEKGVDPKGIEAALDEACHLLLTLSKGVLVPGTIDLQAAPLPSKEILFRPAQVERILGTHFSLTEVKELFHRLGCSVRLSKEKEDLLRVTIPSFRFDLCEEIDLIEEIARLYGYQNLKQGAALSSPSFLPHDPVYLFEEELRTRLVGLGLQEWLTSDLISPKLASFAREMILPSLSLLQAEHAKTEEYSILRPSLLPGLLQVAKRNFDHKNFDLLAFEIGRIHFLQNGSLVELPMVSLLFSGKKSPAHWSEKGKETDFYDLKGLLEALFHGLRLPPPTFSPAAHGSFHPHRQANIVFEDKIVGSFGELHPSLLTKFGIEARVLFAELNAEMLRSLQKGAATMTSLPQFPASQRDWTIALSLRLPLETLLTHLRTLSSPLLEKTELIDLYFPEGGAQKNATFRFTYRDREKTVSFEEVEQTHHMLLSSLSNFLQSGKSSE